MAAIDLRFDNVSKIYRVTADTPMAPGLAGRVRHWLRPPANDFVALNKVSFEVARAETIGIVGHNGAGKSTILKILSNITSPTSGQITIHGNLTALIEVGSGFHPELTGRENVYMSGSILGMRRAEIARKLDRIAAFAGVEKFLDTPIKRYSSGMVVRLGFSVAAHLEPQILLLDEVLAVGDAAFQRKCIERIQEMRDSGITIVFISHDLDAVEKLCARSLLMRRGELVADGPTKEIITRYQQESVFTPSDSADRQSNHRKVIQTTGLEMFDGTGTNTTSFTAAGFLRARISYTAFEPIRDVEAGLFFLAADGRVLAQFSNRFLGQRLDIAVGPGVIEFTCPSLGLLPGVYYIDTSFENLAESELHDWQHRCATIKVEAQEPIRGEFMMAHTFRHITE